MKLTANYLSSALLVALACLAVSANARPQGQTDFSKIEIKATKITDSFYTLEGQGGMIGILVGPDGVFMVDSQYAPLTEKIVAAVKQITNQPIRFMVNTHVHPDHTGGNEKARAMGRTITGGNVAGNISDAAEGAAIYAHDNVLKAMTARGTNPPTPTGAWPTDTYFTETKELFFNGEALQLFHPKAAHTDGDTIVFFRRSDVVLTGDIFSTTTYPIIDLQRGGSLNGIVDALNFILDITIPADKQEGGTMVIPGHGRLCDEADVVEYRDMVTIIRDRIRDMIKKGMSLEQVKAARPTRDYDPLYGATTGPWTTDMFVEAAYKSLSGGK